MLAETARTEDAFVQAMRRQPDDFRGLSFQTSAQAVARPPWGWGEVDPKWVDDASRPPLHVCERGHLWAAWSCQLRTQDDADYASSYTGWKNLYNSGYNEGEE
jgi:hypothetical protein